MLATPRRPHVAFVLPGLGAGGSERIVSMLSNYFAEQSWSVTVLAFEDEERRPYYYHSPAVRVLPLGSKPQPRNPLGAVAAMRRRGRLLRGALRRLSPDILISFLTRTNVLAVLAARDLGIPVIVSERNNPRRQKVGPIWESARRWTYARATGLVTMTAGAMSYFPPSVGRLSRVIPNPAVPTSLAAGHASDGRTIGAVGRLVPQKGFDLLLEAFAEAAQHVPDWRLVIWGEGPERSRLHTQRDRLGLSGRVEFPGVTPHPGDWIARSDMFVLSSRFEGWGLVVGEAMAAGLPVVSFDCEWGPGEMIEDGRSGLLVPSGEVASLAAAMTSLCHDEQRRLAFGRAAQQRMALFTPERMLRSWEDLVTEVLAGSAKRRS